ncbi:MAG: DNA polymerase III subunit alpha [Oscillospiraceae bacterium]|nr:DNA polymerase III subunit alpha [Oscillospiraceae bacterium]
MSFVNLHVHSEYSLLEGACRIPDMVACARSLGQTALALTDHDMFGAVQFTTECREQGIKPLIGCELSVSGDGADRIRSYHITLICKNAAGYKNLCKLVSLAYKEDENRSQVTFAVLSAHAEGLVCLSGDRQGEVPSRAASGDMKGAVSAAERYRGVFGEDYYIEVYDHFTRSDKILLDSLYRLSDSTGIPLAASNDCHYVRKDEANIQRILLAVRDNVPVSNASVYETDEYYIKSEAEMLSLFADRPDAVANTAVIADKCTFEMEFGRLHLPKYDLSEKQSAVCGGDSAVYLRKLCEQGLAKRYGTPSDELKKRLAYELDVVISMGYTDYYLIVWDFVTYAKKHDIPVGPGRGSGAGSLAAYCIGITDIDPIRFNLLFERFLNPERVSMPDFDIDFCYERRQEVIDYVVRRYGRDRVAMIVTFGTMAAKAAVRDITRVLDMPYSLGDRISKNIPSFVHISLDDAVKQSKELKELYEGDASARQIIDTARYIEGMPRNTSTHAAGVVICDAPVSDYVPVMIRDGVAATEYTMTALEKTGLLKMDFLGLRNLTVIHDCERFIRRIDPEFSVKDIRDDDEQTYRMLSSGDTAGVFQFESAGMTELLQKFKPRSVEDLTAALSLYRPGPMDSIPKYLYNRNHPNEVTYKHPCLEPILGVTFGCVVYQEQVMEICRTMAGYSYGRADIVRRAMSKKKADVMDKERPAFIEGAKSRGIPEETAASVFDELSGFASYAFNKSHAAAYSVVAFTTAFLKCHYRKEYMAALMSAFSEYTGKISEYMADCGRHGIKILRPDINESGMGFTPCAEGIRFSLLSAKNIGRNIIGDILRERENGRFVTFTDLISRVSMPRRSMESLIKCGALDSFSLNRRQMIENLETIISAAGEFSRDRVEGQLDFFELSDDGPSDIEHTIKPLPEYPRSVLLAGEYEILGMYVTGHPLENASAAARAAGYGDISRAICGRAGDKLSFACMIESIKEHTTKNGDKMAFMTVSDISGLIECVVFPSVYAQAKPCLSQGAAVFISGRLTEGRDKEINIAADDIISADMFEKSLSGGQLFIRCKSTDTDVMRRCADVLKNHSGSQPVYFVLSDTKQTIAHREIKSCAVTGDLLRELSQAAGTDNIRVRVAK